MTASVLLEREAERARLDDALDHARGGSGRLVVIRGPIGVGKTELLRWLRCRAAERGMLVLAAAGGDLEVDFPFGVVRQLFLPALGSMDARDRPRVLQGAAGLSLRVLGDAPPEPERDAGFSVLHGLHWLTVELAERSPTLIAIDDAHWADPPSLRWITYLARRLDGLAAAVTLATRNTVTEPQATLLAHLPVDVADTVTLRPLTLAGTAALLRAMLADPVALDFAVASHDATGGNPLLLRALIASMAEHGVGPTAQAAPIMERLELNAIGRRVVDRVHGLGRPALDVARAIAVLGQSATRPRVEALTEHDEAVVAEALDTLAAAGLVAVTTPLRFVHVLLRSAVYGDLPAALCEQAHRRAARILADDAVEPEQVAAHLVRVEPRAERWIVDQLRAAGRSALAAGAPAAAARFLRRALDEGPTGRSRFDVLFELGSAEMAAHEAEAANSLREAIAAAPEPGARVAAGRALGQLLMLSGDGDGAVDVLERAERDAGDDAAALAAEASLLACAQCGRWERAGCSRRTARCRPPSSSRSAR